MTRDGDQDDVVLDVQEAHAALARAEGDLARLQVDSHQADLAQLDDGHVQGRPVGGERTGRWAVGLIGEKWSFPQIGCEKRKTLCKRLRELTPGILDSCSLLQRNTCTSGYLEFIYIEALEAILMLP